MVPPVQAAPPGAPAPPPAPVMTTFCLMNSSHPSQHVLISVWTEDTKDHQLPTGGLQSLSLQLSQPHKFRFSAIKSAGCPSSICSCNECFIPTGGKVPNARLSHGRGGEGGQHLRLSQRRHQRAGSPGVAPSLSCSVMLTPQPFLPWKPQNGPASLLVENSFSSWSLSLSWLFASVSL